MSWATVLLAAPALTNAGIQIVREVRTQRQAREMNQASQTRPGRSQAPRPGRVSELPSFSDEQRKSLAIISHETKEVSLPPALDMSRPALTLGLWVNAWFESRLRQSAYNGAGEQSVGLFQINMRAHPGHTRAQLEDGHYNTRYMLELIGRERRFEAILKEGASIETLAAAITLWVEQPKDKERKAVQRAKELGKWFPELVNQRAMGWEP